MEGLEKQKAEAYLASVIQSGAEHKTETHQVEVVSTTMTPAEAARAAAVEAIKAMNPPVEAAVTPVEGGIPKIELETTRDLGKILNKMEGVVAVPKPIEVSAGDTEDRSMNKAARMAVEQGSNAPQTRESSIADAVILNERVIERPAVPTMASEIAVTPPAEVAAAATTPAEHMTVTEQPQQPWQGKDKRSGPSRGRELSENEREMQLTPRQKRLVDVQGPTMARAARGLNVMQSDDMPAAAQMPKAEMPTPAVVPETEPKSAPSPREIIPPQPYIPDVKPDASSSVDLKVVSKIEDGEAKGWTLTAEKKPEVVATPVVSTPEEEQAFAPQFGASNAEALETMQADADAMKGADVHVASIQPGDVEAALEKGEKVAVPEASVPIIEKALEPVPVEVPKETPPVAEAPKAPEPIPKVAPEKPKAEAAPAKVEITPEKKKSPEHIAKVAESIELNEKFRTLGSGGKSFVRSLYVSRPANAVRALGWRMSIGFNDKVANYFGEKALVSGSHRETNEAKLARAEKQQKDEADELKVLGSRFEISSNVAKKAEEERQAHEGKGRAFKADAEAAGKIETKYKERENIFIERRNKAAEKLAGYVGERLRPFEEKLETIRTTKEKLDAEMGDFQAKRDRLQIERDRLYAEMARMNMAGKPESIRIAYQEIANKHDEHLALAKELLQMRLSRRSALEEQLKEVNAKADTIRPTLQQIKEIPNKMRTSERPRAKVELPEVKDAVPSIAEAIEADDAEQILVSHEAIPDMTSGAFIELWNTFAGGDIPMNVDEFAAFIGADKDKELPTKELLQALEGRFDAMLADKRDKRLRVDRDTVLKNVKAFKNIYLRLHHTTS